MIKKIILMLCLAFAYGQKLNAQVNFGIKGGVNYNSNSIEEIGAVGTNVFEGAESKTGYHAGIWLRFKLPVIGFYIRPELVYTNLENKITYLITSSKTTYSFQKIDIPVLFGKKIFGVGNVFVGPSFQYVLASGFDFADISNVETDNFTVGLQVGAGIEVSKIGIDVRWETAFSGIASSFVRTSGAPEVNFDTRVNQVIVGLSYKF